jgi:hypothetical protein
MISGFGMIKMSTKPSHTEQEAMKYLSSPPTTDGILKAPKSNTNLQTPYMEVTCHQTP